MSGTQDQMQTTQDQMQTTQDQMQTTPAVPTVSSYLSEVPDAQTHMQSQPVDESAVISTQTSVLLEKLKSLSSSNPSVTVELTSPLNYQLYNELVNKGYSVSKSSSYRSTNGQRTESHTVTVSLPGHVSWPTMDFPVMPLPSMSLPLPRSYRSSRGYRSQSDGWPFLTWPGNLLYLC
jgi:hypothetical protein